MKDCDRIHSEHDSKQFSNVVVFGILFDVLPHMIKSPQIMTVLGRFTETTERIDTCKVSMRNVEIDIGHKNEKTYFALLMIHTDLCDVREHDLH